MEDSKEPVDRGKGRGKKGVCKQGVPEIGEFNIHAIGEEVTQANQGGAVLTLLSGPHSSNRGGRGQKGWYGIGKRK